VKRVNVLYVIWSLDTGGAEQVVAALAKGLDSQRFRTIVCCLNWEGELADSVKNHGIPIIALNKRKGFDPMIIGKLRRLMRQYEIDVVHTHLWTSNFWGRIAAATARVPAVVATEHNVDLWKSPYHFFCDRQLARVTSRVVYVSDAVKSFYVGKTGIDAPKGLRIHNGIETSGFRTGGDSSKLRADMGIAQDAKVITTIGRLVPQKGHRLFVDTMKRVHARCPEAIGLIVGDGELHQDLEGYIREQDLEKVVSLTGLRSDIPQILKLSDVFVLSSFHEGFPITILEAMATGRCCVVTDVGGNREAVETGVTGFVVPAGDVGALADPISRLLSDDSLRLEMGGAAQERVDRLFSLESMVEQTEHLYAEILSGSR